MTIAIAPGGPGSRPTWTSSAKDMVSTAPAGSGSRWATASSTRSTGQQRGYRRFGILGFIVAGPSEWFEVKRVNRYHVSMPDDWVPLPQVAHEGDGYRLLIEALPDPSRDVVLILYRLTGDNMNLYALLTPHLSNGGEHNNARAAEDLTAWMARIRGTPAVCPYATNCQLGYDLVCVLVPVIWRCCSAVRADLEVRVGSRRKA
jgi:glucoamylase